MTSPARRPPVDPARSRVSARFRCTLATVATRFVLSVVPLVVVTAAPRTAAADERQVCVSASEKGQQLRSTGKLVEAREQFNLCGRTECPKLIQQDCTQWMSEVLTSLPSVVPGAKDRKGRDIVDARLSIDGKVVTETLDGKPIVLDPGVHAFLFEAKGAAAAGGTPTVMEQVVVKPGEKNRIVTVTFATGDDGGTGAGTGAGGGATEPRAEAAKSSPPIAAFVVGGIGIVALGAAGVLGLLANSDARDLRDTCAPNCKQADVDSIQTRYTIGAVTAGVGGVMLITGVVLLIVHGSGSSRTGSSAPSLPFRLQPFATAPRGTGALLRF
jgi:hypothetical protein